MNDQEEIVEEPLPLVFSSRPALISVPEEAPKLIAPSP
jgi:hypothetical protein